jgi:serine/threonine-protein kinase
MALETGTLLNNRYRIEEVIAQGGMGAIYRATDESLSVVVAVKENLFTHDEFSRQFHREATILAGMRHPHLPRVTDHFIVSGQGQYLVMDFIEGEDLRSRLKRSGVIAESEALLIGLAISDALTYLHSRQPQIVHRDIKPGNIKISPNGLIFLVDFGLAKFTHPDQATTVGAQSLTPGFAPPEQYGQGTDPRSDIYSLAATLYASLTNLTPEDGLARAMGSVDLIPLRERNPKVRAEIAAVIERAMSVHREDRYQTAAEFYQALLNTNTLVRRRVEDSGAIQFTPPPNPGGSTTENIPADLGPAGPGAAAAGAAAATAASQGPASTPLRRGKLVYGMAGAIILLVLALGAAVLSRLPSLQAPLRGTKTSLEGPSSPSPTSFRAQVSQATPLAGSPNRIRTLPLTHTPLPLTPPTPTLSPTLFGGGNGEIAFVSDRSGLPQVWLMDAQGNILGRVTDMEDGACQPDWSPDGERLVFVSPCPGKQELYRGSSLFIVDVDGTGLIPLDTTPGGDFEPAWSPDGTQILFTTLRDGQAHLYLYTLADDSVLSLSRPSAYDCQGAWSPDGAMIGFITTRNGASQVWTMDTNGENPHEFSRLGFGAVFLPDWSPDGEVVVFSQGQGLSALIAKRVKDKANEFPVNEKVRPIIDAEYSPDGYWLVFESLTGTNVDIYRMTRTGTNLQQLTREEGREFDPTWRPLP